MQKTIEARGVHEREILGVQFQVEEHCILGGKVFQ